MGRGARFVLLLVGNLDLEYAIGSLSLGNAIEFDIDNILDLFAILMSRIPALISTNELEFKVLDVFVALGVVCDDPHIRRFSQVILVLIEEYFGN